MCNLIKRKIYFEVKEVLKEHRIPVVVGLRRIGKTTLLGILHSEEPNSKIFDCSTFSYSSMNELEFYNEVKDTIMNGVKLILLDEIQFFPNWDHMIKSLYDEFVVVGMCDVVVTGSSSMVLTAREMGVNRTRRLFMETWDFNEYCQLTNLPMTFENFEKFLGKGGFPEYAQSDKTFEQLKNEALKPIIEYDIPRAFPGTNSFNILKLVNELAYLTNGEVNEEKLRLKLDLHHRTVSNYINILEKARLLKIVYRVDLRGIEPKRRQYKIYLNPHLHIWLLKTNFSELDNKFKGHIIESYWLHYVKSINGGWDDYYYLKDSKTQREIDFVTLNHGSDVVFNEFIEFKYKDIITSQDESNLFMASSKSKLIICKNTCATTRIKHLSILDLDQSYIFNK